jgi:hypothetical protein
VVYAAMVVLCQLWTYSISWGFVVVKGLRRVRPLLSLDCAASTRGTHVCTSAFGMYRIRLVIMRGVAANSSSLSAILSARFVESWRWCSVEAAAVLTLHTRGDACCRWRRYRGGVSRRIEHCRVRGSSCSIFFAQKVCVAWLVALLYLLLGALARSRRPMYRNEEWRVQLLAISSACIKIGGCRTLRITSGLGAAAASVPCGVACLCRPGGRHRGL